jgi:hypothetical protein
VSLFKKGRIPPRTTPGKKEGTEMTSIDSLKKEEIVDLLQRCWMTHDGMWFFHCLREFGIEKANKINKAAIKSLAPMEIARIRETLGLKKEKAENMQELKDFLVPASQLFIPKFMNIAVSFPAENVIHWEFAPNNCFAFKGIKRIGAIDQYDCGVIYRLACWFDALGLKYRTVPEVKGCLMLKDGTCAGDFIFAF